MSNKQSETSSQGMNSRDADVSDMERGEVDPEVLSEKHDLNYKTEVQVTGRDSQSSNISSSDDTKHDGTRSSAWKDDPRNALNWSSSRKWTMTIFVSLFSFCTTVTSTMLAPAIPDIQSDLKINDTAEAQLVMSSFILSYAFGPLFWAPMSEEFGRLTMVQIGGTFFLVWNIVCGFAHNTPMMVVGRVLSGIGGGGVVTMGPGILSDCWPVERRGRSVANWYIMPVLAVAIGPILGGQVAEYTTWRWAFWSTSIFEAMLQIVALVCLRECHGPTIQRRIYKKQQRQQQQQQQQHQPTSPPPPPPPPTTIVPPSRPLLTTITRAFGRPCYLLATQPAIQLAALQGGIMQGLVYLIIAVYADTLTSVYGETTAHASLHYISIGIGALLGSQLIAPLIDRYHAHVKARVERSGTRRVTPELRIPLLVPSTLTATAGFLVYGWSARPDVPWIVLDLGAGIAVMGLQAASNCMNAYTIDAYAAAGWSASASASVWTMKSLCGFLFPLFAPQAVARLGQGWAGTLWAAVTLVSHAFVAGVLWCYGERLRAFGEPRLLMLKRKMER